VLDVKFGAAAFMQTKQQARKLAQAMVALGNQCGVRTRALLTNMDTPLGHAAGNWLEVKESVACLAPRSRARESTDARRSAAQPSANSRSRLQGTDDLRSLVLTCAAHLLVQTSKSRSLAAARQQAEACLNSGAPRRKWDEMLVAQGANLDAFNQKLALDHTAPAVVELKAEKSGFVSKCDAQIIGEVVRDLGGGRLTKESGINHDVGVDQLAKPVEAVQAGDVLARIHAANPARARAAHARLKPAFAITPEPPATSPLIAEVIPPDR